MESQEYLIGYSNTNQRQANGDIVFFSYKSSNSSPKNIYIDFICNTLEYF